jgi:Glycosyltransferase family 92
MLFGNVTSRNKKQHLFSNASSQRLPSQYLRGGNNGMTIGSLPNAPYRSLRNTYRSQIDPHQHRCVRFVSRTILFVFVAVILGTIYFTTKTIPHSYSKTILAPLEKQNDLPLVDTTIKGNQIRSDQIDLDHRQEEAFHDTPSLDKQGIPNDDHSHNANDAGGANQPKSEEDEEDLLPGYVEERNEQMDMKVEITPPKAAEDAVGRNEKKGSDKKSSKDDDTDVIPNLQPGLTAQNDPIFVSPKEPTVNSVETAPHDETFGNVPKTIPPKGFAFTTVEEFDRHQTMAERALKANNDATILRKVITAYIEPPMQDTVPNTGSRGDFSDPSDKGTPPDFIDPLPLRTHTPNDLRKFEYPLVQTCNDMPGKFPIDRGLQFDESGELVVWNVGNEPTPPDFPEQEAKHCPVELDPFLPWIHDVFPSQDGSRIEFIAQNRRRCRTGSEYTENVNRLIPQVTLLQSVSVERILDNKAKEMAPSLWHPNKTNVDNPPDEKEVEDDTPRYRLAPYEYASPDGKYTRFICRFHMTTAMDGAASITVALGETLSVYPFNYEYINYRKDQPSLLSPKGKDSLMFWTSNLHFSCPLPENTALRHAIANGKTVLSDGTPTVHVDVVPIRTSVRYNELHLPEAFIGPIKDLLQPVFDPVRRWGLNHVLPRVEASGRWANIPICLPPTLVEEQIVVTETEFDSLETTKVSRKFVPNVEELPAPQFLIGCLWASTSFRTRGKERNASTDTIDRLKEWIEFHLMVGFDHIYVYDNSGAHTNETSLEETLTLFPGKVTRIDWPSTVCNNNIPAHDSTGERSSQYAAESSCRTYVSNLFADQ